MIEFERNPLQFLCRVRELGDAVRLPSGKKSPTYVINSPEYIREILVNQEKSFRKGRSSSILKDTLGYGILTSEGTQHEQQRKMMLPAFHKQRIAAYAELVVGSARELLKTWQPGETRSITDEMMRLTARIITRTMFGTDLDEELIEKVRQAVDVCVTHSAKRLFSPIPLPLSLPTPGNRKFKRAVEFLDESVQKMIQSAKAERNSERDDLLSLLVSARLEETGEFLTDEEIRNQVVTILIAGHETTANALCWAFYAMSQSPSVDQKFADEMKRNQELLQISTYEHLNDFGYTYQIFQETLRLFPPAWGILRESVEEVHICGEKIPANATLIICPYAIHRDPLWHEDPENFNPDRFGWPQMKSNPKFSYFPFGGGSRSCIGMNFAMMEAVLILAVIGSRFQLVLAGRHHPIRPEPLVSLRIRKGLRMKLVARES